MDDPYTPYYPGDDSVDWVGLCFYHWGNTADLGRNEVPPPEKWGEDIKIAWIDQVYNFNDTSIPTLADAFPMLKAIIWFSNFTYESETGFHIDWTLTSNQGVNDHYRQVVADPYFIKAP